MELPSKEEFELLATIRYDPVLLAASRENAAIFGAACSTPVPGETKDVDAKPNEDAQKISTPVYLPHLHLKRFLDATEGLSWHLSTSGEGQSMFSGVQHFNDWICAEVESREQQDSVLKLRLLLDHSGKLTLQSDAIQGVAYLENFFPPSFADPATILQDATHKSADASTAWRQKPNWSVVIDSEPTPDSAGGVNPHLRYKTTHRPLYEASRRRMSAAKKSHIEDKRLHGHMEEVLLINEDGFVVDGSITSVYFWRDGQWVTPYVTEDHKAGALISTTKSFALSKQLCVEGNVHKGSIQQQEVVWLSNAVRGFGWGIIG